MLFEEPFLTHPMWPQAQSDAMLVGIFICACASDLHYSSLQPTRLFGAHETSAGRTRGNKDGWEVVHNEAGQTFRLRLLFEATTGCDMTSQRGEAS